VNESLEQQLRADPDDAAAWLVYADALIEQGDPRGTLVRIPRKLTTQEEKAWRGVIPIACATRRLHGFIVALELPFEPRMPPTLAAILEEPQARLAGSLCVRHVSYRYGDDDKLVIPAPSGPHFADTLATNATVRDPLLALDLRRFRRLAFQHVSLGDAGIAALATARIGPLVSLDLSYCELGDAGIAKLSRLLEGVRSLSLPRNGITAAGAHLLAGCSALAQLEHLDLRFNPIGPDGARAIASSPHLGRLARLIVYPDDIGSAGVEALATMPGAARRYWRARL
jgi:uncharacterized protein (TIGR02996 family)